MTWCPRRRSLLASFSLTGILLVVIFMHKNSENFKGEIVLKSSELRSDFVSDLGIEASPNVVEASQNGIEAPNIENIDDTNVRIKKTAEVSEGGILLREYTIFNNIERKNDLGSKNKKAFSIKEKNNITQKSALNENGGQFVEEKSKYISVTTVEPMVREKNVKEPSKKYPNCIDNNLKENEKDKDSVQLLSKSDVINLGSSIKTKDEQNYQSKLEFLHNVNNENDVRKYQNDKLEEASKNKDKKENAALKHVEDKNQETSVENGEEEINPNLPVSRNSEKGKPQNFVNIFENLNLNNSISDFKSDKSRSTTEKAKAVLFSSGSTSSTRSIISSSISSIRSSSSTRSSNSVSNIRSSSISSSNISNSSSSSLSNSSSSIISLSSARNPKDKKQSLNLTAPNNVNQKQNLLNNESLSRKMGKALNVPSYEKVFMQLIDSNKRFIKRLFSKELKDIDFDPGEMVPSDKMRRVLIVSTWRSGSTFLGDIFNSYPAAFYSFEPLHMKYRNKHLQKGEDIDEALSFMRDILTCNISSHHEYMKYLREYEYVLTHNKFMWNSCYVNRAYCFDSNFMTKICQHAPLNVMKTVRLGLLPVEKLLNDTALDLKVIHLVRDPRGSLHSRLKLRWCKSKICRDPKTVCDSLYTDLKLSDLYLKKYPERFQVIRYEDLSLNPRNVSQKILQFAGLHFHRGTERFLKEHTELQDSGRTQQIGAYTTFRDSQKIPFQWRDTFTFPQINYIQKMCKNPLDALGFRIFHSQNDYKNKNISVIINS